MVAAELWYHGLPWAIIVGKINLNLLIFNNTGYIFLMKVFLFHSSGFVSNIIKPVPDIWSWLDELYTCFFMSFGKRTSIMNFECQFFVKVLRRSIRHDLCVRSHSIFSLRVHSMQPQISHRPTDQLFVPWPYSTTAQYLITTFAGS